MGMTQPQTPPHADRKVLIRQLEQFPVEVLEAALLILQMRTRQSAAQPPSGT